MLKSGGIFLYVYVYIYKNMALTIWELLSFGVFKTDAKQSNAG